MAVGRFRPGLGSLTAQRAFVFKDSRQAADLSSSRCFRSCRKQARRDLETVSRESGPEPSVRRPFQVDSVLWPLSQGESGPVRVQLQSFKLAGWTGGRTRSGLGGLCLQIADCGSRGPTDRCSAESARGGPAARRLSVTPRYTAFARVRAD